MQINYSISGPRKTTGFRLKATEISKSEVNPFKQKAFAVENKTETSDRKLTASD